MFLQIVGVYTQLHEVHYHNPADWIPHNHQYNNRKSYAVILYWFGLLHKPTHLSFSKKAGKWPSQYTALWHRIQYASSHELTKPTVPGLALQSPVVNKGTTRFTTKKISAFWPHHVLVSHVILTINSNHFHIQLLRTVDSYLEQTVLCEVQTDSPCI